MCEPIISPANLNCDCATVVTEVNILIYYSTDWIVLLKWTRVRKKLRVQCPCGYAFNVLSSEKDAITKIRLHFELFHKNFLPFGITNAEALSLLKKGSQHRKRKVTLSNFITQE